MPQEAHSDTATSGLPTSSGEAEKRTIPGHPNLRVPTSEEARQMGRLGGKRSAESRRRRKSMAEALDEYLSARLQPSHPRYAEIKRMLRTMGLLGEGEEPDNQMLLLAGMMQRAQKDPTAAAFIRDTVGERPTENIAATIDTPPPVVIGIHDAAWIESERRRQERMVEDMRRTALDVPAVQVRAEEPSEGEGAGHRADAGQDGPGARGAEGVQPSAGTAPAQQKGATAPSAPPPRPPAPPPRPVDPNVCLPSATPPR